MDTSVSILKYSRVSVLIMLLICLIDSSSLAEIVRPELAKNVAINYSIERGLITQEFDQSLFVLNYVRTQNDDTLFYVFDIGLNGFIIVAAVDAIYPVLGWSDQGHFGQSDIPPALEWLLDNYSQQICFIRDQSIESTHGIDTVWNHFSLLPMDFHSTQNQITGVPPLIKAKWNQGEYYNAYCPHDSLGHGGKAWAGCVATALGQIMFYYRYPQTGIGSNTYTHPTYGNLSANFGNTTYRWDEMDYFASPKNYDAIAELLYHIGVSLYMNYGPYGSGAVPSSNVLHNTFNYDQNVTTEYSSSYSSQTWNNLLKSNLNAGYPIFYVGGTGMPHAFIIDGYQDTNHFHVNWGWSGMYDGYYFLNSLLPGSWNFNSNQYAIINIKPPATAYPHFCGQNQLVSGISGTLEDGSGPINHYQNQSDCSWLISPTTATARFITIDFDRFSTESVNDVLYIYDGTDTTAPLLAELSGDTMPPAIKTSGGSAYIKFVTNDSINSFGWLLRYEAFPYQYGDQLYNPHIQPNVVNGGRVHFNYYGSGDANGDGEIDYQDYIALQNNLANDRTDLNSDGVTDSLDLTLLDSLLTGQIKYLPAHWDLLQDSSERITWLERMLSIDSITKIPLDTAWTYDHCLLQTFINFRGLTGEIKQVAGAYGFDLNSNAKFDLPTYFIQTKTNTNQGCDFLGILTGDSATCISNWYFFEPVTNARVYPGIYNNNPNSWVRIRSSGTGFDYNDAFFLRDYQLIDFQLVNGNDSLVSVHPYTQILRNLVPLEPTNEIFPNDTLIELGNPTDTSAVGYITNITPGAHVWHTDSIDSVNIDNYDIYRTFGWKPFHSYIDSIAPTTVLFEYPWTWLSVDSLGTQKIEVRDTQSPFVVSVPNTLYLIYGDSIPNINGVIFTDNSNAPLNIIYTDSTTQDPDTLNPPHYSYDIWKKVIASDISGNTTDTTYLFAEIRTIPIVITGVSQPYLVVFGESIPQPQISFTGTPALPIAINFQDSTTQSTNPDSCSYFNYEQWIKAELMDASGNTVDTTFKNADVYKPNYSLVFLNVPVDTLVDKNFQVTQANLNGFVHVTDTMYTTNALYLSHDTTLIWSSLFEMRYDVVTIATGSCGCTRDTSWRLVKWLGYSTEDIHDEKVSFMLYPVPASDVLNILAKNIEPGRVHWEINHIQGGSIASGSFIHEPSQMQSINLTGLAAGVYILHLHTGQKSYTRRFIKGW